MTNPEKIPVQEEVSKSKGFFAAVERVGNKMPHPATLFLYLTAIVLILSCVLSLAHVTAVHPTTGELVEVENMLSVSGLQMILTDFIDNFQAFPVLGVVLVLGAMTGLCEKLGLFNTAIKLSVSKLSGNMVVFAIALISVISKQAGDAAQILMPILAGAIFYGMGRHPLAGVFCAYAAVGAGFASSIIPGGMEVNLTPITVSSAQMLEPDFDLSVLSSYFALTATGFVIAIVTTIVTVKYVEPRLGTYTGVPDGIEEINENIQVTEEQKAAAKKAGISVLILLALVVVCCIPQSSFFRSEEGSLIFRSTLMSALPTIIALMFFVPGVVYGKETGQIKNSSDIINYMSEAVSTLSPFIVMAMVIGQFLRFFSLSNIGTLTAIKGGEFLGAASLPPQLIVILFLVLVAVINILMSSGMTKYLIFGPIFIPMLMQLNIHPAFTHFVYRVGDGITNIITPLDVVFIMLLATCQKYDKETGMGTMLSYLIPYSVAYFAVMAVIIVVWMTLGIDVGFGGQVWLN